MVLLSDFFENVVTSGRRTGRGPWHPRRACALHERDGAVEQPQRADDAEDKDEPKECLQHRKREIGQAQHVHVIDNRELQDGEA